MENPFKFGTLVDNEYFTDRVMEQQHIRSMLESPNHIVLISPRRFGKSSLVKRVVRQSGRPFISLNMQQGRKAIRTEVLAHQHYIQFYQKTDEKGISNQRRRLRGRRPILQAMDHSSVGNFTLTLCFSTSMNLVKK